MSSKKPYKLCPFKIGDRVNYDCVAGDRVERGTVNKIVNAAEVWVGFDGYNKNRRMTIADLTLYKQVVPPDELEDDDVVEAKVEGDTLLEKFNNKWDDLKTGVEDTLESNFNHHAIELRSLKFKIKDFEEAVDDLEVALKKIL